jgi:heme-degrading monooxygenase HmoA
MSMVCRVWHGWTTLDGASDYEELVRGQVIPDIEARRIPGFLQIDLVRRDVHDEVEFMTVMWFVDLDAVTAFVGADRELAHVPAAARAVLSRFDERVAHYEVLDRREQRSSLP